MGVKRILIADDDPGLVALLHDSLQPLGLEIRQAHTVIAALAAAHQDPLDLAILDIHMPGGNGLGACEMLAADPTFAHLAVIILSGQADEPTWHRCRKLGAHYVCKGPEAIERVRRLVCHLLSLGPASPPTADQLFVG